jgi:oligopeptide/dipeptide ABC transporter ATP-binding protein
MIPAGTTVGAPTDPAAGATSATVARVRDLRIRFRTKRGHVHAVDGVSFDVREGEILGLVGETGCGKSVTARSFLRILPSPPAIVEGKIAFSSATRPCSACDGAGCGSCDATGRDTLDLLTIPEEHIQRIRGDRIAMIFQDPGKALNPALAIRRQLSEVFLQHRSDEVIEAAGLDLSALPPPERRIVRRAAEDRGSVIELLLLRMPPFVRSGRKFRKALDDLIGDALAETRIPDPRKIMASYPHQLSGGMRQRVMIAQALACDPELLIADEPTTALDVTIQARIVDLIKELQERRGTAVLYITHDLALVREISDRIAIMYAGRLAEVGDPDDTFRSPLHPYTRGLLGANPGAGEPKARLTAIEGTVPELIDPPTACRFATRCPHAGAVCHQRVPELVVVGERQHVACYLHEDATALGVDPAAMPDPARTLADPPARGEERA